MANNPGEAPSHDFLEQLLEMQTYAAAAADPNLAGTADVNLAPMMLQLNSAAGGYHAPPPVFPLGLSLDQGKPAFLKPDEGAGSGSGGGNKRFREDMVDASKNVFHGQPMPSPVPAAPPQAAVRPRVRARRGQATDPHSIAERLRRERIAERIRALQELVPSVNKTDRAAMLDEIVDYVKFLRLQVKVLSMSRLGGAGAVVPLVTDMPISSVEVRKKGAGCWGPGRILQYAADFLHPQRKRKKAVIVGRVNLCGKNGPMMGPKDKLLSSWKRMLGQQCNSFNPRHFASCPSRWLRLSTTHSHQTQARSSSQSQTHLHKLLSKVVVLPPPPQTGNLVNSQRAPRYVALQIQPPKRSDQSSLF